MYVYEMFASLQAQRPTVRRMATRVAGQVEGDDVMQEAFLRLFTGARPSGDTSRPLAWFTGLMRNVHRDNKRRDRRRAARERLLAMSLPTVPHDLEEAHHRTTLMALVTDALAQLAPRDRQVLELTILQELNASTVSIRLGVPPVTLRRRKQVALARLRTRVQRRLGGVVSRPRPITR